MLADPSLVGVLERARTLGFLGPGPVEGHIEHAGAFVAAIAERGGLVVDLGAGGGVPGLVVALARSDLQVQLVDSVAKRCRFLEDAVVALDLGERVRVIESRAEDLGRGQQRGTVDVVLARSFGPPAATAECAAPLLVVGGWLVVSEPPSDRGARWRERPLAQLGLRPRHGTLTGPRLQVLEQVAPCPDRFPRRVGVPAKRPLF